MIDYYWQNQRLFRLLIKWLTAIQLLVTLALGFIFNLLSVFSLSNFYFNIKLLNLILVILNTKAHIFISHYDLQNMKLVQDGLCILVVIK